MSELGHIARCEETTKINEFHIAYQIVAQLDTNMHLVYTFTRIMLLLTVWREARILGQFNERTACLDWMPAERFRTQQIRRTVQPLVFFI